MHLCTDLKAVFPGVGSGHNFREDGIGGSFFCLQVQSHLSISGISGTEFEFQCPNNMGTWKTTCKSFLASRSEKTVASQNELQCAVQVAKRKVECLSLLSVPMLSCCVWGNLWYNTVMYLWYTVIYTWNPSHPCFDWKRPCFGGFNHQNRVHSAHPSHSQHPHLSDPILFELHQICAPQPWELAVKWIIRGNPLFESKTTDRCLE